MRNIVILNSLHFSYPLPILMRVSYNTLIVKQNTSDYYKYDKKVITSTFIPFSFSEDDISPKNIIFKSTPYFLGVYLQKTYKKQDYPLKSRG